MFIKVLAILFTLLVFSCEEYSPIGTVDPPITKPPQYSQDGTPMVDVIINMGDITRALSPNLARNSINFFEVSFKYTPLGGGPAQYFRSSWPADQVGSISVPVGTYHAPGNDTPGNNAPGNSDDLPDNTAVLFAGRLSGGIRSLLAVGALTGANGSGDATTISLDTTAMTFSLTALTNNISGNDSDSTFLISTPSGSTIETLTIDGGSVPAYSILTADPVVNITVVYGITIPHSNAVRLSGTYQGAFVSIGTPDPIGGHPPVTPEITGVEIVRGLATSPGVLPMGTVATESWVEGHPVPRLTGVSDSEQSAFLISLSSGPGLSMLYMQVPVRAFINQDPLNRGLLWQIRGGFNNIAPDLGDDSMGGAVLLLVVEDD
ncbi:MAG: hypothetical protein FWG77_08335 [Treponema sp.]|nr:hypothetical protein [Treponema sp.]